MISNCQISTACPHQKAEHLLKSNKNPFCTDEMALVVNSETKLMKEHTLQDAL